MEIDGTTEGRNDKSDESSMRIATETARGESHEKR
jgi:hypothetical protein